MVSHETNVKNHTQNNQKLNLSDNKLQYIVLKDNSQVCSIPERYLTSTEEWS